MTESTSAIDEVGRTKSETFTLEFEQPVSIDAWRKFCASNGLSFCPNLGKSNVYVGYGIEITLDSEGSVLDGVQLPPREFSSMVVVYGHYNDNARSLIIQIGEHFDAKENTFEGEQESVASMQLRLMEQIRDSLQDSFGKSPDDMEASISSSLGDILDQHPGIVRGGVDNIARVEVTWEMLYPRRWARIRAKFAYEVLQVPTVVSKRPSRLLRWLGYHGEQKVMVCDHTKYTDIMEEYENTPFAVEEALAARAIRIKTHSRLRIPYWTIRADLSIQPAQPVNSVKINLVLDNKDD